MTDLPTTIFWLRLLQLLIAIPLFALAGQGATFALTRLMGQVPQQNFIYRLFEVIASPVVKPCRWIAPRFIPDRHLPLVAFAVLLVAYGWVVLEIASTCAAHGLPVAECLERR